MRVWFSGWWLGSHQCPEASGALREQLQFVALADGGPAVAHAELGVDVLLVGAHGVQGHDKLTGDLGTAQVSPEKAEHVQLAVAQWIEQRLLRRAVVIGRARDRQDLAGITTCGSLTCERSQQRTHRGALVSEDPDVAFWLGKTDRTLEGRKRCRHVSLRLVRERLQGQDLDDRSSPPPALRLRQKSVQESNRVPQRLLRTLCPVKRQED